MPLMKYFSFVGSALLLLLLGLNWFLPQAVSEPIGAGIQRPVIRISSVEKLPERVIIDTSLPTIAPSPPATQLAERPTDAEVAGPVDVQVAGAKRLTRAADSITTDRSVKATNLAKSQPSKKSAALRPVQLPSQFSSTYPKQAVAPVTRMSLLDIIKDRFGRGFFKLN
jgi:hypothetical protein